MMTIIILLVILYLVIGWRVGRMFIKPAMMRQMYNVKTNEDWNTRADGIEWGMLTYFSVLWPMVILYGVTVFIAKAIFK